jgi:hypothetical protein
MSRRIEAWHRLPEIVRFLIGTAATGSGTAAVFVGALVVMNPNSAGTVLLTAAHHGWPVVALWFITGLTFATIQMGGARKRRPVGDTMALTPVAIRARRR